jgi:hypothetical protein
LDYHTHSHSLSFYLSPLCLFFPFLLHSLHYLNFVKETIIKFTSKFNNGSPSVIRNKIYFKIIRHHPRHQHSHDLIFHRTKFVFEVPFSNLLSSLTFSVSPSVCVFLSWRPHLFSSFGIQELVLNTTKHSRPI